jgi:antitoxin VapB
LRARGALAAFCRDELQTRFEVSTSRGQLRISLLDIRKDNAMTSSTVFTSNRSQAVRLPKAVAFPEDVHQVDILKIGRSRVIVPQGKRWDDLFQNGPRLTEDFIVEREQPPAEEREQF